LLRKADISDIPALKAVRASVIENVLSDPSKVGDGHYEWFVTNPGVAVWEERGEILGFSAADPRDGGIWALFVTPNCEGRGIGTTLLAEACAVLKAAGVRRAWLTTDPGTRAERFYRVAGWEPAGQKDNELLFELSL
jgi:GNAT superfamily N-acetyltransferase